MLPLVDILIVVMQIIRNFIAMIKKFIVWITNSNHYKHLCYGIAIGLGANDWYCAEYVALGVSGALEFKDKQWGGSWDWIDFALTFIGVNIGYLIRYLVFKQ